MKITEEFTQNSILSESLFTMAKEEFQDLDSEAFFGDILVSYFGELKRFSAMFLQITGDLIQSKYPESRKGFLIKDSFSLTFTADICRMRAIIKSLLTGIIKTSSISTVNEIAQYKIEWNGYDNFDKSQKSDNYHHHLMYQQFKKVETLDELVKFNALFHQYLIEMIFKMNEIFIRRMTYTIEYLQNDEGFKEVCGEATLNLRNFRNEIEKLKRRPLDVNHIGIPIAIGRTQRKI